MPASCRRLLNRWKREADPVELFLEECTDQVVEVGNKQTWAPKSDVWDAWEHWREENGYQQMRRQTFKTRMKHAGIKDGKSGEKRWQLRLTDDWAQAEDTNSDTSFM